MSILNYFKAPDPQADDDPSTDSSPDAGESQSGEMSSCSSSLPQVSDSEEDPSLPLLLDSHFRDVCIRQGPFTSASCER